MYHHCLFCSADLGHNETVEALPVGRRLAFDAFKGRLWVVCPRCRRWNLTPLEERWEPVEALEKRFRESRLRVQSENIGVARLREGTTLVRIGQALPGELAAWRYGREQRRRHQLISASMVAGAAAGLFTHGITAGLVLAGNLAWVVARSRRQRQPAHVVPAELSPTGARLVLTPAHLWYSTFTADESGLTLQVPTVPVRMADRRTWSWEAALPMPRVSITGAAAGRLAARGMLLANQWGGTGAQVSEALDILMLAGSADGYLTRVGSRPARLVPAMGMLGPRVESRPPLELGRSKRPGPARVLSPLESLALEMALNDEKERRALDGELAQLQEDWREAEMLATIADALPDDVAVVAPALGASRP